MAKATRVKNLCTIETFTAKDGTEQKQFTNYGGLLKNDNGRFFVMFKGVPAPTITRKLINGVETFEAMYIFQVCDLKRESDPFQKTDAVPVKATEPVSDLTPDANASEAPF